MRSTNTRPLPVRLPLLLAATVALSEPALALDRDDTMTAWRQATAGDRSRLLYRLQADSPKLRRADRDKLMECLNAAAAFPQHGDFRIADLVDACADPDAPAGNDI